MCLVSTGRHKTMSTSGTPTKTARDGHDQLGRNVTSRDSMLASAMKCSTERSSTRCAKVRSSSSFGASARTRDAPHSASGYHPPAPETNKNVERGPFTNQPSNRTNQAGPITVPNGRGIRFRKRGKRCMPLRRKVPRRLIINRDNFSRFVAISMAGGMVDLLPNRTHDRKNNIRKCVELRGGIMTGERSSTRSG